MSSKDKTTMAEKIAEAKKPAEEPKVKYADEEFAHESLAEAKIAVMKEVAYCQKIGSNGISYTYASEGQLIAVVRPAMIRHRITISPIAVQQLLAEDFKSKNSGSIQHLVRASVRYRVSAVCQRIAANSMNTHESYIDSEEIEVFGEGCDLQDKASPKAMTIAMKYAIRQTFLIECGDDPDKFKMQDVVRLNNDQDLEREKSFHKFLGAVEMAEGMEKLTRLRTVYLHERDFTEDQKEELEAVHQKRLTALEAMKKE